MIIFFSQYWQISWVQKAIMYWILLRKDSIQVWLTLHSIKPILKIVGNVPINIAVIWWLFTSQWGLWPTECRSIASFSYSKRTYCINTLCLVFTINAYSGFDLNPLNLGSINLGLSCLKNSLSPLKIQEAQITQCIWALTFVRSRCPWQWMLLAKLLALRGLCTFTVVHLYTVISFH